METPSPCPPHDWRRVYPRHITDQAQTSAEEGVMFMLCCRCGRSPRIFVKRQEWRAYYRTAGGQGGFQDWPTELKITDYEWDDEEGPRVTFIRRGKDDAGPG